MRRLLGVALAIGTPASAVRAEPNSAQHGANVFAAHGCSFCHGPQLAGTERAPNIQLVRKRLKAAQIEQQIRGGGKGMPAFGEQLTPDEVADLVRFLRSSHPERLMPPVPSGRK